MSAIPVPGEALGGCSGDVAEAADWARGIASEWGPVVARLDGGRTTTGDRLLWTIYARPDVEPSREQRVEAAEDRAEQSAFDAWRERR